MLKVPAARVREHRPSAAKTAGGAAGGGTARLPGVHARLQVGRLFKVMDTRNYQGLH